MCMSDSQRCPIHGPGPRDQLVADRRLLFAAMRELGYVERQNVLIERRSAEGHLERLSELAAGLISTDADVLVSADGATVGPLKEATNRNPIVMMVVGDPVQAGYVASLRRLGGNITGLTNYGDAITGKRLEVVTQVVPGLKRVSALAPPDNSEPPALRGAASNLALDLQEFPVSNAEHLDQAIDSAVVGGAQATVVLGSAVTNNNAARVVTLLAQYRLP